MKKMSLKPINYVKKKTEKVQRFVDHSKEVFKQKKSIKEQDNLILDFYDSGLSPEEYCTKFHLSESTKIFLEAMQSLQEEKIKGGGRSQ